MDHNACFSAADYRQSQILLDSSAGWYLNLPRALISLICGSRLIGHRI
jgi:hypothetical protein